MPGASYMPGLALQRPSLGHLQRGRACGDAGSEHAGFAEGTCRSAAHRERRQDCRRLRAFRFLHLRVPDLRARRRRERFTARTHRLDQGNARLRDGARTQDCDARRQVSYLSVVRDDLCRRRGLSTTRRHGARVHRGVEGAATRRARVPKDTCSGAPITAPAADGNGIGAAFQWLAGAPAGSRWCIGTDCAGARYEGVCAARCGEC